MLALTIKNSAEMYKSRISAWGLAKKHKRVEFEAILRKKAQRDAAGKATCFKLRGCVADLEDVERYSKRAKLVPGAEAVG